MKTFTYTAFVVLAGITARAQHVDVLVWDDGGKVGVGEYNFDNGMPSENRVHGTRLIGGSGADAYTSDAPGFTSVGGASALPGSEDLTWDFLPMTVDSGPHDGYRSTLLYWDGVGTEVQLGPTVTDEYRFSIESLLGVAAATGSPDTEPGSTIVRTPPSGSIHEHPIFFLDDNGDGTSDTAPAAGIYVVALEVAIGELTPSDPVYMVWQTPESSLLTSRRRTSLWIEQRLDTLAVEPLEGDFNGDGLVNAADYTTWRDGLGTDYQPSDYGTWAGNYGTTGSTGAPSAAVPEPSASLLLAAIAAASFQSRCFSSVRV